MACWIRTAIIVTNNGTILFGNADILPVVGKDNSKDTDTVETDKQTDTIQGGAAAEGVADTASARRRAKRKRRGGWKR